MARDKKGVSIRTQIAMGSLVVVLLAWCILAGLSYVTSSALIDITSRQIFKSAADEISSEIQGAFQPLLNNTVLFADSRLVNTTTLDERLQSLRLLVDVLQQSPEATAIYVGYQNGDHFMVRQLRSPGLREALNAPEGGEYVVDHHYGDRHEPSVRRFYDRSLALVSQLSLTGSDYDPRVRPWFKQAQESDEAITTSPYVFFSSRQIGITIAKRTADRQAVMATDIALDTVAGYLDQQRITEHAELALRTKEGLVAWSTDSSLVLEKDKLRQKRLHDIDHPLFAALAAGKELEGWLTYREHIPLLLNYDVELLIGVPRDEFLSELGGMRNKILLYSFFVMILIVPLAWLMANRISRPLRELHDSVSRVDRETFSLQLPPLRGRDEVRELNLALRDMSETLQLHIADLKEATAARQKFESEMDIARHIQMDFVPGSGELSTTLGQDPFYARLKPARAVGGDLYQMFELSDGRYFVAIGDVSDKGAPAALYMSKTVGLIRMLAPEAVSAAALLDQLNTELARDNESCMFVTLFCGYYDPTSGKLQYASAGHNPPVLVRNGKAEFLAVNSGMALGVFEGMGFTDQYLDMANGTELYLYTDGITEAFDADCNEFSEERLLHTVQSLKPEMSARDHGEAILDRVHTFAAGANQSDDITLVILRRREDD